MRLLFFILALLLFSLSAHADVDGDPLYANLVQTNGATFYAWRPFYSASEEGERWRKDYLWPLYTRKGFKEETYGRFLFFGYSTDFSTDVDRHRNWVIPFWFQGTSKEGEDYFAFFPLGGTIHEFLGRDSASFVLFPLYARSHINDVRTTSVVWPIGSKTEGEGIDRFRVWPLYGRSELEGEYIKKFYIWPIVSTVEYTNERNPGGGYIIVPLYGHVSTELAENYWLVAPFIRYMQSEEQWIVHAPWPFIQLADGDLKKRIFWPLYGKKSLGTLTRRFFFWPIVWESSTRYAQHDRNRTLVLPVFVHESDVVNKTTESQTEGDVLNRYWKIWPLMSWERVGETARFRTLELWPLRNTPGIERNWAPWWTLYRRVESEGETGHHLLWGLYRHTEGPSGSEWSLLKGVAGYRKTATNRACRVLFMWFGEEEQP